MYDLIIIGAGPAGLTAAIYSDRYQLNYLIIGQEIGGTALEAFKIENYPGFQSISGKELMDKIVAQVEKEIVQEEVEKITKQNEFFKISLEGGNSFQGRTLILATGGKPRKLGIKGEDKFLGKGISYCFSCDGPLFKDKIVAVVGGSNAALTGALDLARVAKKVYLIHRGDQFSPNTVPKWQEQVKQNDRINIIMETNVKQAKGNSSLKEILLDSGQSLKVDGLFIEIGVVPNTALVKNIGAKTAKQGASTFVKVNEKQATNVEGFYAAGDITNQPVRQIITSCGQGATAATAAHQYLREKF